VISSAVWGSDFLRSKRSANAVLFSFRFIPFRLIHHDGKRDGSSYVSLRFGTVQAKIATALQRIVHYILLYTTTTTRLSGSSPCEIHSAD